MINLTLVNLERLRRVYEKFVPTDFEQQAIAKLAPQTWIVIGQSWCGDVSSSLPIMAKLTAQASNHIKLRVILRDQNVEVMDQYLSPTGGRSIPVLIKFGADNEEIGKWGSRPKELMEVAAEWKAQKMHFMEQIKHMRDWYDQEANQHLVAAEILMMSGV